MVIGIDADADADAGGRRGRRNGASRFVGTEHRAKHGTGPDYAARNDAARNDAARNDAARNDASGNDAARNDAARDDAARNDVSGNDAACDARACGRACRAAEDRHILEIPRHGQELCGRLHAGTKG